MNEVIRAILERRSVRSYDGRMPEDDKVETILECGKFAPSAMNRQPWHFTVIRDRELMDRISAANKKMLIESGDERSVAMASEEGFDNFCGAPMAIVVSGDESNYYGMSDCAGAVENMALAAHSLGLANLYIASFMRALVLEENAELLAELGLPKGYKPHFALCLGYSKEELGERAPRKEGSVNYIG